MVGSTMKCYMGKLTVTIMKTNLTLSAGKQLLTEVWISCTPSSLLLAMNEVMEGVGSMTHTEPLSAASYQHLMLVVNWPATQKCDVKNIVKKDGFFLQNVFVGC